MHKLLDKIKLYGIVVSDNQHFFYANKTQIQIKSGVLQGEPIILSQLYRSFRYPSLRKGVTLHSILYYEESNQKKYGKHGLGFALILLRFLFAFYKFGCTSIKTTLMVKPRKGKSYPLLEMKRKWKLSPLTYLFYPILSQFPFFYMGKYDKKTVFFIRKHSNVVKLCEKVLKGGVTLPELIDTYKQLGKDLSEKGFEFGKTLINVVNMLEKRTA